MGLFGFSKDKNKIKLTKEKHVITDDDAGFEYEIDTSFKQIRSNAMEVEALAVYASEGRENKHSDVPCVMVLTDSGIYEAIETYNEKGLSEGMKPANGMFLYKTLTEYYGDQLYYYAFEKDNKKHSVDVRVIHKDGSIILRIKDDCVPFDPKERSLITDSADPCKNIGIRLVYSIMKDIDYRNILGLNVLTIKI